MTWFRWPLIGTANPTLHARLPHCAVGGSDRHSSSLLLVCPWSTRERVSPVTVIPRSPRVNPLQSSITRFLAWAVSWPITIGIVVWWWLEAERPA
jgi:hypothetical protein